jgi:hypothetical protein
MDSLILPFFIDEYFVIFDIAQWCNFPSLISSLPKLNLYLTKNNFILLSLKSQATWLHF